jgi:hypothetical protein
MRRCSSAGSRWRTLGAVAVACALSGSSGCLTFEKQTLVLVFPRGSQEVRGLLVYEGLHAAGHTPADLARAKEELAGLFEGEQEIRLSGWPLRFQLAPQPGDSEEVRLWRALLRKHLVIRKGGFFLDAEGKLGGYQTVTIRDRGKFVPELNRRISQSMAGVAARGLADPKGRGAVWDEESLRLVQRACTKEFPWVQIEAGRVCLTAPASPALTRRLKRAVLEEAASLPWLRDVAEGKRRGALRHELPAVLSRTEEAVTWLADVPWGFDQHADRFTVSLGLGGGEPIRVVLANGNRGGPREWDKELMAYARQLRVPHHAGLTAERLIADFLRGRPAGKKP